MAEIFIIEGDKTLKELNEIISFQESKNCEFLENEIVEGDSLENKAAFELYDDASVPKALVLKTKKQPPAGCEKEPFWTGPMAVNGKRTDVYAYRSKKKDTK